MREDCATATFRRMAEANARRVDELKMALVLAVKRSRTASGSEAMFDIDDRLKVLGVEIFHSDGPKFLW